MAKNQVSNKPNNTAPAAPAPVAPAVDQQNLQEGADNNAVDQSKITDEQRVTDLAISFPEEPVDGIKQALTLLKEAYPNEDIDARMVALFTPAADTTAVAENTERNDLILVTGFELAFPLDALADDIAAGMQAVQNALNARTAPEGETFPEGLIDFQFPLTALERYIQGVLHQGTRLEDAELVFADPAVDPTLRTLNFTRLLQGLEPTHFYLRFL